MSGVQSRFSHLSRDDIAHPPHHWFDAALARQIAIHISVRRYEVSLRRIARELERNKGSVMKALQTVEQRLQNRTFAESYAAMSEEADAAMRSSSSTIGDE